MYRAIQKLPLIGAVIASSLLASCSEEVRMHSPTAESVVEIGFEGRTTSGAIATNNLSSQVSGREATARLRPADMDALGRLVDILLKRTQYLGTYSDFQRAVQVAEQAMARSEGSDAAKLISARVDSALHRFDSARETLESLGRVTAATIRLESTIGLALNNDLEPLAENRRTDAHQYPNYQTLSALAAAESALGHYDLADGLYVRALQSYGDVSPFPVAWVQFQRGVMWAEAADQPERALPLYREAVARLPGYVVANVHLAELESQMGQMDQAIERLRRITAQTQDPEPAGLLGELLLANRPEEARGFIEAARTGYEQLLARHSAAFADHAAEFFSGPGNAPQRALALALANLERRPTDRARQVAIEVALGAGAGEVACRLAAELPKPPASLVLRRLLEHTLDGC